MEDLFSTRKGIVFKDVQVDENSIYLEINQGQECLSSAQFQKKVGEVFRENAGKNILFGLSTNGHVRTAHFLIREPHPGGE